MLADLFPHVADNRYRGQTLGLWLFGLMPLKIAMGLNVMLNARTVAQSAGGVPLQTFDPHSASAFLFMFASWGLCQFVLGAASLVILLRYRSLVPLAFLTLLLEQIGRKLLHLRWPIDNVDPSPGSMPFCSASWCRVSCSPCGVAALPSTGPNKQQSCTAPGTTQATRNPRLSAHNDCGFRQRGHKSNSVKGIGDWDPMVARADTRGTRALARFWGSYAWLVQTNRVLGTTARSVHPQPRVLAWFVAAGFRWHSHRSFRYALRTGCFRRGSGPGIAHAIFLMETCAGGCLFWTLRAVRRSSNSGRATRPDPGHCRCCRYMAPCLTPVHCHIAHGWNDHHRAWLRHGLG